MAQDHRLSVIVEDGDAHVRTVPPKAYHRPFSRNWYLGDPPRHSYEKSPPAYRVWNKPGPRREKLADVRNNKFIARRGGWKRLLILALVIVAVLVALIVGLVLGLRKKKHNSSQASAPPSSSSSSPTGPFPIGSYALNTFLDTVSTNCTSNSATWRCYPYTTYSSSPTAALATFNWIITASASSSGNYTISSTDNPFAINFVNASLTLLDANAATERYNFQIPINKIVVPSAAITSDNQIANCFFNATQFEANLYTKMPKTYPPASSSTASAASPSSTAATAFESWPYAVEVTQTIGGGSGVPDCFEVVNGNLGEQITDGLTAQAAGDMCSCAYKNYDP
ncbi:hypothetical protein MMC08_004339 [Hypocenomyce scalaris]|nr:hypothetical protein [Hypocenomyce scalaris]